MEKPNYIFIEVMDRTIFCPEFFETLEEAKKHMFEVLFEVNGWDWDACSNLSSKELHDYCYENFENDGEWGITSDACAAWVNETCSGDWDGEIFEKEADGEYRHIIDQSLLNSTEIFSV